MRAARCTSSSEVAVADDQRLPGVDRPSERGAADPASARWPARRRRDGVVRAFECVEERVALRVHLVARARTPRASLRRCSSSVCAYSSVPSSASRRVGLLDVREDERHGSGRRRAHSRTLRWTGERAPLRHRRRSAHAVRACWAAASRSTRRPSSAAVVIKAAMERIGLEPNEPEYVIMGQVLQAGAGQAPARQAAIGAGLPIETPADTINKVCASSIRAVEIADAMIRAGDARVRRHGRHGVDVERALRAEEGALRLPARATATLIDLDGLRDGLTLDVRRAAHGPAGRRWSPASSASRARSRTRGRSARTSAPRPRRTSGRFDDEIVPVGDVDRGRGRSRRDTTLEKLAELKPVFDPGGDDDGGQRARRQRRRVVRRRHVGGVRAPPRPGGARRRSSRRATSPTSSRTSRARPRTRPDIARSRRRGRRSTTSSGSRSTRRSPRSRSTRRACSAPTRRS